MRVYSLKALRRRAAVAAAAALRVLLKNFWVVCDVTGTLCDAELGSSVLGGIYIKITRTSYFDIL